MQVHHNGQFCSLAILDPKLRGISKTVSNSSLFTPALLRTHSFVFFAIHETRRIFLSPFISKASRHVFPLFLSVQLSQLYIATGHTSAFITLSLLKSVCCDFSIFSTVMPRSPALCLTWYGIPSYILTIFCNQGPMVNVNVSTCCSCSF